MKPEPDRQSPFSILALAALALLGIALIVPLVDGRPGLEQALPGGLVRAAPSDSFALSEPLTLLEAPRLVLEDGTVSAGGGQGGSGTGQALYKMLMGGGADLVLERATMTLHWEQASRSLPPGGGAAGELAPLASALARLDFGTLLVRNGTVVVRTDGYSDTKLRNVNAEIKSDRKGSLRIKGRFDLRGETLDADIALTGPKSERDGSVAVRASLNGALVSASLDGRLLSERMQITAGAAELALPRLDEAARWFGADWPRGQGVASFEAKGPMEWSDRTIAFEGSKFRLGASTASGGLSLKFGQERPAIEGTLAFDSLDLTPFLRAEEPATTLAVATDWLSSLPLPFSLSPSLVRAVDADLRISAASVSLADQVLGRCAAALSIKDGKLFADVAEIELENGGIGDGQLAADVTGADPLYKLRGKLESFDVGRATTAYLGRPAVEGLGTLLVELAGQGRTVEAVLDTLSGNVAIDISEGARLGTDVFALDQIDAKAPLASGWERLPKGTTNAESLSARFAASSGVFTAQTVQATVGDTVVTAAGTVSAAEKVIDLTILVAKSAGQEGESGAADKPPPAKAFRVHGPLQAPTIKRVSGPEKIGFAADR